MIQHGLQVCGGDVSHDFVPDQREHLVLDRAFQAVVGGTLYRWEFENLQPVGQAVLYGFLRFVCVTYLRVELCDVAGNLLLCFRLGFAGEYFAACLTPCSSKYQMTLCQRPSVRLKTLPLVVSRFFGMVGGCSFRVVLSTTNTTV